MGFQWFHPILYLFTFCAVPTLETGVVFNVKSNVFPNINTFIKVLHRNIITVYSTFVCTFVRHWLWPVTDKFKLKSRGVFVIAVISGWPQVPVKAWLKDSGTNMSFHWLSTIEAGAQVSIHCIILFDISGRFLSLSLNYITFATLRQLIKAINIWRLWKYAYPHKVCRCVAINCDFSWFKHGLPQRASGTYNTSPKMISAYYSSTTATSKHLKYNILKGFV